MSHHSDEQHPSASSDSFWEIGNYKRTTKRIEDGHRLCDDLMRLVQDRAEIEKMYAKQLKDWAKKWNNLIEKGPEYGTTEAAWKAVLMESEQVSDLHISVKENLMNQVHGNLKNWQKENYHKSMMGQLKEKRDSEELFKKAQKQWSKLYERVNKARHDYHTACKGERTALIQERNANADSGLSPDQKAVPIYCFSSQLITMKTPTYTCHKCHAEFSSRAEANKHYTGKWHQYNLMRALKELSPINHETYEKLMNKSSFLEEAKNRINTISCQACKKSFTSQGSFETHQRSRKHKQNVIRKAAEKVRRLKIQKLKEAQRATAAEGHSQPEEETVENDSEKDEEEEEQTAINVVPKDSTYCTVCKVAFAAEKDLEKHSETLKHRNSLKLAQLSQERKQELDKQDELLTTKDDDMEVEEVDSDEWEEDDDAMEQDKDDSKPLPLSVCLFCSKRSANLTDNLGHMERQHSFIVPHQHAGDMEQLQQYLGEKVGTHHECLECSKPFRSLRACRLHMLDKPHLAIRFEGEYDAFFDVSKIVADVQLPPKPKDNDIFVVPLPDGTMLMHRDLRRYFKQGLSVQSATNNLKRLQGTGPRAISHLGKASVEAKSVMEIRKENRRRQRAVNIQLKTHDKKRLDVGVKANKLQKHFRPQVINAG